MAEFSSPVSLEISVLESLMTPLSASSTGMFLDDVMVVSTRSWDTNAEDKDAGRAACQYLDTARLLARILGGHGRKGRGLIVMTRTSKTNSLADWAREKDSASFSSGSFDTSVIS